MTTTEKKHYAWVGQNASTGTPHLTTGRMSMYGDNMVFDDKSERDRFVDEFRSNNPSIFAQACTYRQLRSYNLGCSVFDFEQDLNYCRYAYVTTEDCDGHETECCEKLY